MTLAQAKLGARRMGFTLSLKDGEFSLRDRHNGSTYYTADLYDAMNTAEAIREREMNEACGALTDALTADLASATSNAERDDIMARATPFLSRNEAAEIASVEPSITDRLIERALTARYGPRFASLPLPQRRLMLDCIAERLVPTSALIEHVLSIAAGYIEADLRYAEQEARSCTLTANER